MCQDILNILMKLDIHSIDTQMVLQCSPILRGIKISNLLILKKTECRNIKIILDKSDISYRLLYESESRAIYLLYRYDELNVYLREKSSVELLAAEGYRSLCLDDVFIRFKRRYRLYTDGVIDYPHEIGILLGYPAEDVRGFIENSGGNYLYIGYWKVYDKLLDKIKLFHRYEIARDVLIRQLGDGICISEMLVGFQNRRKYVS